MRSKNNSGSGPSINHATFFLNGYSLLLFFTLSGHLAILETVYKKNISLGTILIVSFFLAVFLPVFRIIFQGNIINYDADTKIMFFFLFVTQLLSLVYVYIYLSRTEGSSYFFLFLLWAILADTGLIRAIAKGDNFLEEDLDHNDVHFLPVFIGCFLQTVLFFALAFYFKVDWSFVLYILVGSTMIFGEYLPKWLTKNHKT